MLDGVMRGQVSAGETLATLALRDLEGAAAEIAAWAALLDAQLAQDRSSSGLRDLVHAVRAEAQHLADVLESRCQSGSRPNI